MDKAGTIVSVQFQAEGLHGNWNFELRDPATDLPIQGLPARALDDAIFCLSELCDIGPMHELQNFRASRAQTIEHNFLKCAQKLIESIEADEGWDHWFDRIHKKEP